MRCLLSSERSTVEECKTNGLHFFFTMSVVLVVDKAKTEPRSIQVLYKDGNIVTYTLKRFTANPPLADGLFSFDKTKFPGVEVNDMR